MQTICYRLSCPNVLTTLTVPALVSWQAGTGTGGCTDPSVLAVWVAQRFATVATKVSNRATGISCNRSSRRNYGAGYNKT